jgi:hypothetical protein
VSESRQVSKFIVSLYAATCIWYLSTLLAAYLGNSHVAVKPPDQLYKMYWAAYFDEYRERMYFVALVAQSVLFGFALRFIPSVSIPATNILLLGTIGAILLIPLAAIGVHGISIVANWPAAAPPQEIQGGWLWSLPGTMLLAISLCQVIVKSRKTAQ